MTEDTKSRREFLKIAAAGAAGLGAATTASAAGVALSKDEFVAI